MYGVVVLCQVTTIHLGDGVSPVNASVLVVRTNESDGLQGTHVSAAEGYAYRSGPRSRSRCNR